MLQRLIRKIHNWVCQEPTKYYYANGDEIITMGHQLLLEVMTEQTNKSKTKTIMENKEEEVTTAVATVPKIYYLNSKPRTITVPWISRRGIGHFTKVNDKRVTVAVCANDKVLMYGVAICSPDDNFVGEKGRQLARERLLNGFCVIPKDKIRFTGDLHSSVVQFAKNLLQAVEDDPFKFERRIANFNAIIKSLKEHPPVDEVEV